MTGTLRMSVIAYRDHGDPWIIKKQDLTIDEAVHLN
jgi:hypothetical protein